MRLVSTAGYISTSFQTLPPLTAIRSRTLDEAVAALSDNENAVVLAGGTDLPAQFNEGFAPKTLVDISGIGELRDIKVTSGALEIGAMVTHYSGGTNALVREVLPSFAQAWSRIANVRIRFSATLGGNLMARRTRYEGSILLSALGARLRLVSRTGETEMPVEDLWQAKAPPGALLTTVVIPLRKGLKLDYARDLRPIMTQAVAMEEGAAGRVVTATEFIVPRIRRLSVDGGAEGVVDIPDGSDPVTSSDYLRKVSAVLLTRQVQRMRAS